MTLLSSPKQFLSTNNIVITPFITIAIEGTVYGIYTILFALYIYILESPNRPVSHLKLYTPALVPLYALATLGFTLSVANVIQTTAAYVDVLKGESIANMMMRGRDSLVLSGLTHSMFLLSNVIVDGVLIYRTYIIWGCRKRVIIVPGIVSLASNGVGIAAISTQLSAKFTSLADLKSFMDGNYMMMTFLGTVAFTQLMLTFMIAGRIWWISRRIGPYGSSAMRKTVKTILAVTLESGILYTILLVIYEIQNAASPVAIDLGLYPLLIQFAGISPTLIIVRAALGMSVEDDPNIHARTLSLPVTVDMPVPPSSPVITVVLPGSPSRSSPRLPERTLAAKSYHNFDIERVTPFAVSKV